MGRTKVLKIRVSLKGRPLKTYRFTKEKVTIGRSPDSDVFLDNPGVSRTHIVLERASNGSYRLDDQGSANGTSINDEQVKSEILMADDIVRIGKFSLWIEYESDLRDEPGLGKPRVSPQTYQGTTVLSTTELEGMLAHARTSDREVKREQEASFVDLEPAGAGSPGGPAGKILLGVSLAAFGIGSLTGAYVTWLLSH